MDDDSSIDEKYQTNYVNVEDIDQMEPLAQITSLFGEHYSENGLKTIHGICSIKEGKIDDIDMNIMRRGLLNGNCFLNLSHKLKHLSKNFQVLVYLTFFILQQNIIEEINQYVL